MDPLPLYKRLLEQSWSELAEPLRRAHWVEEAVYGSGTFRIVRGKGPINKLLAWWLQLPHENPSAHTLLTITPHGETELWQRWFDQRMMMTVQWRDGDGLLVERFGPMELRLRLHVCAGGITYQQVNATLCIGSLRLPLPRALAPTIEASEEPATPNQMKTKVKVTVPLTGLLISYEGHLEF